MPCSMRDFLPAPHTRLGGPSLLAREVLSGSSSSPDHRPLTEMDGDATKPLTPWLATVDAAEQAPVRHKVGDTAAGRGGGGGASPRT
jgi:hypothetical protein